MRDAKVKTSSDRNQCKKVKNLQESAARNVKKKKSSALSMAVIYIGSMNLEMRAK